MSYYFFDPFEDLMDDWFFGFPRVSRRRQAALQQQQHGAVPPDEEEATVTGLEHRPEPPTPREEK
jgi:hypothetical protein